MLCRWLAAYRLTADLGRIAAAKSIYDDRRRRRTRGGNDAGGGGGRLCYLPVLMGIKFVYERYAQKSQSSWEHRGSNLFLNDHSANGLTAGGVWRTRRKLALEASGVILADNRLKSPNFCWDKRALVLKYFLRIFWGSTLPEDRGVRTVKWSIPKFSF